MVASEAGSEEEEVDELKKELKRGKLGQLREFPGTFGIKVGHDYSKIENNQDG